MKQISIFAVLAASSIPTVLGLAQSHQHHHRALGFKRDGAPMVMNNDGGGVLESIVVANATACGCSTSLTTLYGAMSSANPATISTVFTTSYSTKTVFVTANATIVASSAASSLQSTTVSQQIVQNVSSDTRPTTTVYSTKLCSGSTSQASPLASNSAASESFSSSSSSDPLVPSSLLIGSPSSSHIGDASSAFSPSSVIGPSIEAVSSSSSIQAVLSPPSRSEKNGPAAFAPAPSVSIVSSPDPEGYASYSSLAPAAKALDAIGSSRPSASASAENALPKPWAISYSVYTPDVQACKLASDMVADVEAIAKKDFSTIRLYTTDCGVLSAIGDAVRAANMKIIPCIYLSDRLDDVHQQIEDLRNWAKWDLVELIIVGNEALNAGLLNGVDVLVQNINSARSTFRAAGYQGSVTTAETINIWQDNASTLCDTVDIAGANIHPFFDPNTVAPDAGEFVLNQLMILHKLCPGKSIVNLETGWPSAGDGCVDKACPDPEDQRKAILSLRELDPRVQAVLTYFSWDNENWKGHGFDGVEAHWGLKDLF